MCSMIIGIDLDQTLVYMEESVVKIAAKNTKTKSYPKRFDYNFSEFPEEMRKEIFRLFEDPIYMKRIVPLPGAVNKLNQWKKEGHKIVIITARDLSVEEVTREAVKKYFPMVDALHFVGIGNSKEVLFKSEKIDVWVDDNPKDVIASTKMGIRTCLISNSHTCYNWDIKGKVMAHVYTSVADVNFY